MNLDSIKTVGVLGAGTMGNGIAHVFASGGYGVVLRDIEQRFLDRALDTIGKNLDREIKKGKYPETARATILSRIVATTDADALAGCDFVVEAVTENQDLKCKILAAADSIMKPGVILASNTSTISITTLAAATRRASQFIGMHFMNPVPVMQLVEVIRGIETSDEAFTTTMALAQKLGKTPCAVNDAPGFVSNRVLMPMINEAIFCVHENVATPESVDTVMKLGMNHPLGPLALADLIGLDTCLAILEVLYKDFADSKYRPCPLLRKMVAAGRLGRKSGRGFYVYP